MKIRFISDVVLDPVIKKLKKTFTQLEVHSNYQEDIVAFLLTNSESVDEKDVILIHSDQHFHKKPIEWQKSYLSSIISFSLKFSNPIIISNSLNLSFAKRPSTKSVGVIEDAYQMYSSFYSSLLQRSNSYLFDFNLLCNQVGFLNTYQFTLGHLYQMPYTKQFIKLFADTLGEQLRWLQQEEKKAIVIDCDNTLWKGVIGEDGLEGIRCDNNAESIIFYHFQLFLKTKKEEGFVLCICSKNNMDDVKEVFEQKNMPLKWNDFVVKKINWEDKLGNIHKIAEELNISIDSLIYIDDNPFEVSSVWELSKGISCFEFKDDYGAFIELTNSFLFRRKQILQDDVQKSDQYFVEFQRWEEEKRYQSIEEFIKGLSIQLDIRLNDVNDFDRLAQMTGKTNQFNFNKKVYSKDDLTKFIKEDNRIYSVKVTDKFGSYGTVGLMLLEIDEDKAIIENYLMSCRALGKRIENDFYNCVIEKLMQDNIVIKEIKFTQTSKNQPAQKFIKDQALKVNSYAN